MANNESFIKENITLLNNLKHIQEIDKEHSLFTTLEHFKIKIIETTLQAFLVYPTLESLYFSFSDLNSIMTNDDSNKQLIHTFMLWDSAENIKKTKAYQEFAGYSSIYEKFTDYSYLYLKEKENESIIPYYKNFNLYQSYNIENQNDDNTICITPSNFNEILFDEFSYLLKDKNLLEQLRINLEQESYNGKTVYEIGFIFINEDGTYCDDFTSDLHEILGSSLNKKIIAYFQNEKLEKFLYNNNELNTRKNKI